MNLIQDQYFATAKDRPETLIEIDISHGEILGILEPENMYWKRHNNPKDIKRINKHLADALQAALGKQEEEPITVDTVELGFHEKIQQCTISCSLHLMESIYFSWVEPDPTCRDDTSTTAKTFRESTTFCSMKLDNNVWRRVEIV